MGMYVCQPCLELYDLEPAFGTVSAGICEICNGSPRFLVFTWSVDRLKLWSGMTVVEQLHARTLPTLVAQFYRDIGGEA